MAVLLAPGASPAQTEVGVILVEQGGVRPFPPTATTFHPSWFGPWLPLATMPYQVTDSVGTLIDVER